MSAFSICPTAVWSLSGTTVTGSTGIRLKTPIAIIVDNNSNIYAADNTNYRVLQFPANSTKGTLKINGSFGTGLNQFSSMTDMGMDANGNIYILDGTLARVTKWTPGSASGILVAGGGPFNDYFDGLVDSMGQPGGMFIEPQSMFIWIADTNNSRIVKWVNSSTALTVCGSYGSNSNQFINPKGIFIDTAANNTLYVVDSGNHRVQMWLPGATSGKTVAGITGYYGTGLNQLWNPLAIVVDSNQNMYIADVTNARILQWKVGASFGVNIEGITAYGTSSITFDPNGSLFFADTYNNRVLRYTVSCLPIMTSNCPMTVWAQNATTIAGSPNGIQGFTSTLFNNLVGIMVGKNDSIYAIDWGTYYRMQLFYPGSQSGITIFNATFGSDLNQLYDVSALNIDVSGNIYILDYYYDRVTKWAPGASTGILVAGGNGQGTSLNQLNTPYDLFVEPNTSYIWIADYYNCRIVKWMNTSTGTLVAGGNNCGIQANQFNGPTGLFIDISDSNTFYVADYGNHRIQKWLYGASNGTTVAGQSSGVSGSALNQLNKPFHLTMDTNKSLYIADYGNNRIVLWLLGATSGILIAGSGIAGVLPSQLYKPYSVGLDSTGALIVNDYGNNRIQRFPVLCSPNTISSSSTSSVLTNSTSIAATLQNTTITVPLTTNSLTTSTNNPTIIQSASTSITNSVTVLATVSSLATVTSSTKVSTSAIVTPSTTISTSTLVTTSQMSSSTNTITKLSSTMPSSSQSSNHSFAIRNLNSKLLVLSFCFIMIFINN
ncbi:unnamed protein product [Adineta steineri]|uniref:NHL repeat containing protein-like protein n=1 Tax=Adineta steineri TaxID=433720 RepID=A0A814IVE0_9BILA|nr:unnamed protein product [Adineta steineri]CAF1515543.1 unnamed protein product [Adineta steineri]